MSYVTSIVNIESTSVPITQGPTRYIKCLSSTLKAVKLMRLESKEGKNNSTLLFD
jgi:hypothetical protein